MERKIKNKLNIFCLNRDQKKNSIIKNFKESDYAIDSHSFFYNADDKSFINGEWINRHKQYLNNKAKIKYKIGLNEPFILAMGYDEIDKINKTIKKEEYNNIKKSNDKKELYSVSIGEIPSKKVGDKKIIDLLNYNYQKDNESFQKINDKIYYYNGIKHWYECEDLKFYYDDKLGLFVTDKSYFSPDRLFQYKSPTKEEITKYICENINNVLYNSEFILKENDNLEQPKIKSLMKSII